MIRCPRAEQERNGVTPVECRLDASRLDTRNAPGLDQDREAAGIDHVGNAGTEPAKGQEKQIAALDNDCSPVGSRMPCDSKTLRRKAGGNQARPGNGPNSGKK